MSSNNGRLTLDIVGGGSKLDLFQQLLDIGRGVNIPFNLKVRNPRFKGDMAPKVSIDVWVNGIETEDGSGNSWIISGHVDPKTRSAFPWLADFVDTARNFEGLYNTRARQGHLSKPEK